MSGVENLIALCDCVRPERLVAAGAVVELVRWRR